MVIPCVCYHIEEKDLYEIVDGYHRYMVMKTSQRIYDREKGLLPVVVINKIYLIVWHQRYGTTGLEEVIALN